MSRCRFVVLMCLVPSSLYAQPREPRYQGQPADYWLQRLRSTEPKERLAAMYAVEALGAEVQERAVPILVDMLDDRDNEYRTDALRSLGRLEGTAQKAVPDILPLLRDDDRAVRDWAICAIRGIGPEAHKAAMPVLVELLADGKRRALVLDNLGHLKPAAKSAVPALISLLKDNDVAIRHRALDLVLDLGIDGQEQAIVAVLQDMLKQRDYARQQFAVSCLAKLGPAAKKTVPDLVPLLKEEAARLEVVAVLGKLGKDAAPAVPALVELLEESMKQKADASRLSIVETLGKIGPDAAAAVPVIKRMFDKAGPGTMENSGHLRQQLIASLGQLGPDAAPVLMDIFEQTKKEWVRESVVVALQEMGAHGKAVAPRLIKALPAADRTCRAEGALALWKIARHPAALTTFAQVLDEFASQKLEPPAKGSPVVLGTARSIDPLLSESPKNSHENGDPNTSVVRLRSADRVCYQVAIIFSELDQAIPELGTVCKSLKKLLDNPSHEARREATWALYVASRDQELIPRLTRCVCYGPDEALPDDNVLRIDVRTVNMLGMIGPRAASALPALRKGLSEATNTPHLSRHECKVCEVREAITSAIAKIEEREEAGDD